MRANKTYLKHATKVLLDRDKLLWTQKGSNLRPPDYESGALTN